MTVAFRYIAKELLAVFVMVFALLLVVGLGGRLIGFLQQAATGRFTADAVWLLLGLRVPEFVQLTAPFALTLALLLTFGRLHAEREFVVLTGGGANPARLVLWVLAATAPVVALVGWLSLAVTPAARAAYADVSLDQLSAVEFDAIKAGVFHSFSGGKRVTYAAEVDADAGVLRDVFMSERQGTKHVTVWADNGEIRRDPNTGERMLVLHDGARHEGEPGGHAYTSMRFARMDQRVEPEEFVRPTVDERALPTNALEITGARGAAELHWRIALPILTLLTALAALGVARVRPRSGRFAPVLPGVVLFIGYYLALVLLKNAIAGGLVPAALGLWPVHVAAAALAWWLVRRSYSPA